MRTSLVSGALIAFVLVCAFYSAVAAQTETLDGIRFTPPAGWSRTTKEGVVIFGDSNKSTGRFCILSVYGAVSSTGNPQKDFASRWTDLVVGPFKADAKPETEAKSEDGWTAVTGGSQIESDGIKSIVIMTVYSGFGKTVAVLALLNDQAYIARIDAFNSGIKLDKTTAVNPAVVKAAPAGADSDFLNFDPFPDKPGYQPQQPLMGRLKKSVTMADLTGNWEYGAASVASYFSSATGNYSGTDTVFFAESYTIKPNGTFEKRFTGRSNNHTVREVDNGTVTLSGGFIILTYPGRNTYKYQLIAFMPDSRGGAVLSLMQIGDNEPPLDGNRLSINCGHSKGYVSCVSGEEWVRRPLK